MSRPVWARRDRRPLVGAVSAAFCGIAALTAMLIAAILSSQGLL